MREQVSIDCGPADRDGKRLVIASLGGKSHRDRFDTDRNDLRAKFRNEVVRKFKLPESAHEWLNEAIEQAADEVDEAPALATKLIVVSAADIVPGTAEFLMQGYIVAAAFNDWFGDPGDGKSQAAISIVARLTRGIALPPAHSFEGQFDPCNVIVSNYEDDPARTIVPRLIAAGADLSRVDLITEVKGIDGKPRPLKLPSCIPQIEQRIVERGAKFWLIDPLASCLDAGVSMNTDEDMRGVSGLLHAMAVRTNCAVLSIRHMNKKSGENGMYRASGSIGIIGAARASAVVGRDPEDPEQSRILASVKCNLCPAPKSVRFTIEPFGDTSKVCWGDQCDVTQHDVLGNNQKQGGGSKLEQAKAIITDVLGNGPRGESEVLDAIEAAGISTSTYWRARKALNLHSEKTGYQGKWLLSLNGYQGHQDEF